MHVNCNNDFATTFYKLTILLDYLFNICPFARMKICPVALKIAKVVSKLWHRTKKSPEFRKSGPIFLKSGHTETDWVRIVLSCRRQSVIKLSAPFVLSFFQAHFNSLITGFMSILRLSRNWTKGDVMRESSLCNFVSFIVAVVLRSTQRLFKFVANFKMFLQERHRWRCRRRDPLPPPRPSRKSKRWASTTMTSSKASKSLHPPPSLAAATKG